MKMGVISDTHAHSLKNIPKAVLDTLAGVDLIVHAGDITGISVLRELQKIGKVEAVCGNMCSAEIKAILPESLIFDAEGKRIGLTHGTGGRADIVSKVHRSFSDVDIIIFGHSHAAYSRVVDGVLMFNPGPAAYSCGLLIIDGDEVKSKIIRF